MFPDRAALYVVAIEDRQYKDFKIHCKFSFPCSSGFPFFFIVCVQVGLRRVLGLVNRPLKKYLFLDSFLYMVSSSPKARGLLRGEKYILVYPGRRQSE